MKKGLRTPSPVDGGGSGSSSYHRALKLQRPTVIKWQDRLANSVSLIGSVLFSPNQSNTDNDRFGVHTVLRVKSTRDFGIMLSMWDEMAEIASKHLRRNDWIYVSGRLESYTKASEDGQTKIKFQVQVKELNYVAPILRPYRPAETEVKNSGTGSLESHKYRLHLWQVFFANPSDWWDNRKKKTNSRQPDFRHKDTNEALWLSPYDPPWVKRQLEVLDLAWEQGRSTDAGSKRVIPWDYDEDYASRLLGVALRD
ncbi:hypothetical protein MLD38_022293 [Melastoma candidum]|uniref:Uncharacterized protein n=1 Tax=Melastoma candidum TaxID=119954 RepID=A0ACB9QLU0_9MYRT|nr:hypothetical protein MLD38_022293 [Melastoma candidum]